MDEGLRKETKKYPFLVGGEPGMSSLKKTSRVKSIQKEVITSIRCCRETRKDED